VGLQPLLVAITKITKVASRTRTVWIARRGPDEIRAMLRPLSGGGLELRFMMGDRLIFSHLFGDVAAMQKAADRRRAEMEAKGWTTEEPDKGT
jgi:hypothetical protein